MNEEQKNIVFDKLSRAFHGDLQGKTIAMWGLSFKPETDDMREAPALVVIDKLLKAGAIINVFDPIAMAETKRRIGDVVTYCKDMYEAVIDADAIALLTEWKQFRIPSWAIIHKAMRNHIVVDGRNIYDGEELKELGFHVLKDRTKMKKILVTGGAGFIGSHLCDRLLREGNDVICLDNYFTGSKDNIRHLLGNDHFELVRHDVINPYHAEVDEIYNLACPASPPHYQYNPIKTIKTSVMGAINMLGLAKRTRAKILQASTSEVYGDPAIHPQVESYWGNVNPIGIRSCYDEGKRCAETLFMDYHRQNGVRIKIIRIFNTYGPANEPERRSCGLQLHRTGLERRGHHDLW